MAARDADGDDEDCEQDGHGSDGGKGEEVDDGVIEAEGEEEGPGQGLERICEECCCGSWHSESSGLGIESLKSKFENSQIQNPHPSRKRRG